VSIKYIMPSTKRNNANARELRMVNTYNQIVDIIRSSNTKSDAIKMIKNVRIGGDGEKVGEKYANKIYDKYVRHNGSGSESRLV